MREFVREELPFIPAAGDRIGALVARSSPAFAVLAGIGAGRLAGDVLAATAGIVEDAMRPGARPLPYQVREVAAPAAALIVARRAGGRRAALGYIAFAALVVILRWLGHAISCARIDSEPLVRIVRCDPSVLDRLSGVAPLLLGLALGTVVARGIAGARRQGSNALLEAAGAYAAAPAIVALGSQAFAYEAPQPSPGLVAYAVGTTVVAALVAGFITARRSSTPVRTAFVLAAVLVATWLYPIGWGQLVMTAGADRAERPELMLAGLPLLGPVVIVAVAALARRRPYDPAR